MDIGPWRRLRRRLLISRQPRGLKKLGDTLTKRHEIKTTRIGRGPARSSAGQVLNRVVQATDRGFEIEADPRHAEFVIEQLGLLMSKGVTTPEVDDQEEAEDHANEALDPQAATACRSIAARCKYLAAS